MLWWQWLFVIAFIGISVDFVAALICGTVKQVAQIKYQALTGLRVNTEARKEE